jgi:hypothetical protein
MAKKTHYSIRRGVGTSEIDLGTTGGVIKIPTRLENQVLEALDYIAKLPPEVKPVVNVMPSGGLELIRGKQRSLVMSGKLADVKTSVESLAAMPAAVANSEPEPYLPKSVGQHTAFYRMQKAKHDVWQASQDAANERKRELRDRRELSTAIAERLAALEKEKETKIQDHIAIMGDVSIEKSRLSKDLAVEESRLAMVEVLENPESTTEQKEAAKDAYYTAQWHAK